MSESSLVTFTEAAHLTGVSERTLTRMVARGELHVYWFGTTKRLSRQELLSPRDKAGSGSLTKAAGE